MLQPAPHDGAHERLIHLRARRVVVATGAYETPLPFENNDLAGVMLSSAVRRLLYVHGIVPGNARRDRRTPMRRLMKWPENCVPPVWNRCRRDRAGRWCRRHGAEPGAGLPRPRSGISPAICSWCAGRWFRMRVCCAQAGAELAWNGGDRAFMPADLPAT